MEVMVETLSNAIQIILLSGMFVMLLGIIGTIITWKLSDFIAGRGK